MEQSSCNLGSLNLYEFVDDKFTPIATFNWKEFAKAIKIASNALDEIIDENSKRLPKYLKPYKDNANNWRNIGLGVFNYAHMLMALGFKYGAPDTLSFTNQLFNFMMDTAINYNIERGLKKGSYPKFKADKIKESSIMKLHETEDIPAFRNCSLLSIAPTGSIATMLGGSGGIEPEFQLSYIRKTDNLKESYVIESKVVKDFKKVNGDIKLPSYFVTSKDINWMDRIETQATIQEHIDTAISSTINLPNDITREEIEQLYLYAWERGLKGITIYRDGCKRGGILIDNTKEEKNIQNFSSTPKRGEVTKINDDKVIGLKKKLVSGCGSLHCAAYFDIETGDLKEIYLSKGSTGGCNNFMTGLSRMISMSARAGVKIDDIVDQLMSTGACPSYVACTKTKHDTSKGSCCPMAVGYALKEMWEEFNGIKQKTNKDKTEKEKIMKEKIEVEQNKNKPTCPDCGAELFFEGGCNICRECGYSKCD